MYTLVGAAPRADSWACDRVIRCSHGHEVAVMWLREPHSHLCRNRRTRGTHVRSPPRPESTTTPSRPYTIVNPIAGPFSFPKSFRVSMDCLSFPPFVKEGKKN